MTELVHGPSAAAEAVRASEILFGGGLDGISAATFSEIVGEVPTKEIEKAKLDGPGWPLVELLVVSGLCSSKGQARKDTEGGGVYVNNAREGRVGRGVTAEDLLFGKYLLLRKGTLSPFLLLAFRPDRRAPPCIGSDCGRISTRPSEPCGICRRPPSG